MKNVGFIFDVAKVKKQFLIITVLLFMYLNSYEQELDTLFTFFPDVVGISEVKAFDTVKTKDHLAIFKRDTGKNITVQAFDKSGKILCKGSYKQDSIYVVNSLFVGRSGETEIRPRKIISRFSRNGYWTYYRRGKGKRAYYSNGKKIKIRVNY